MSWTVKLLEVCKRYGSAARFAAKTVLAAVVPGSPAVISLVEQAFETVEEKADSQWAVRVEQRLEASDADLQRLAGVLDILLGDLHPLTAQVARLEKLPDVAAQMVETALAADARSREAARALESLAGQFDQLQRQHQQLLGGQEEMKPLLRRAVGVCDYVEELRATGFSAEVFSELLRAFQNALGLLGRGNVAQAERALEAVAAARPLSAATTVALAAAQSAGHQFLLAEQTLTRACRLRPDDRELTELHQRSTVVSRRGATPLERPASGSHPPRVGDQIDGWRLDELIGHGGWGLVFRASQAGRTMALKVMHGELASDPHFVERFKREIMTLAKLGRHPHLVAIDGFGYATSHACWYFVMEWIDGINLEKHLSRNGPLAWSEAQSLFGRLADGLASAHARGIIHRDIKPANILLREARGKRQEARGNTEGTVSASSSDLPLASCLLPLDLEPVLVDFGLALESDAGLTRTGKAAGYTALFAAPEQIRAHEADTRSDVYSLAASLYYALLYHEPTKREPHHFKPRHVPEAARDILTRALDNDPSERPPDAAAFRDALRESSRSLVVDPAGQGDARTLAEALKKASPGSEIRLRPGRYVESVALDRPVKLIGDGSRDRIILESRQGPCLRVQTTEASVSGLTLTGSGEDRTASPVVDVFQGRLDLADCQVRGGGGIAIQAGGTLMMARCEVHDSRGAGLLFEGGGGTVEDCEIHNTHLVGVQVRQGSGPTLRRCTIHHGKQGGVLFCQRGGGVMEDCDIHSNALSGVDVKTGGDPVLRNCRVRGNRTNGVYVYEQGRGTFDGCEISGHHLQGVAIKEGGAPVLCRCKVHDNRECGIFCYEKGAGVLQDCEVHANGLANVEIKEGADPSLTRCRIRNGRVCGVLVWVSATALFEDCDIHDHVYAGVEVKQGGNPTFLRCRITRNGGSAFYIHEQGTGTVKGCDLRGNKLGPWDLGAGCRVHRDGNQE